MSFVPGDEVERDVSVNEWYVLGLLDVESVKGGVNMVVGSGRVGLWSTRTRRNV